MTRRIYYESAYIKEFDATVTGCTECENGWNVTLDATAFYPEGGGQPADTGTLGGADVTDVQEKGEDVVHTVNAPLAVGKNIHGRVDFGRRLGFMQSHSGEHIFSGIVCARFGCSNTGFHMGSDFMTVDFDYEFSADDIAKAEAEANAAVRSDAVTEIFYTDGSDGVVYRSKKEIEGNVRIVRAGGVDTCACCGLHVSSAGQIGVIKILSWQRFRGGTRLFMVCGERAYEDYAAKNAELYACGDLLSAKPLEIAENVKKLLEDKAALKRELDSERMKTFSMTLRLVNKDTIAPIIFTDAFDGELVGKFGVEAAKDRSKAVIFGGSGGEYKYAFATQTGDVRGDCKALNEAFSGRGGGRAELCRGSVCANKDEIVRFLVKYGYISEETL